MIWNISKDLVTVRTPAKLNLYLEVIGKRKDGFHELETVITTIDLFDQITIQPKPSPGIDLNCEWVHPSISNRKNFAFVEANPELLGRSESCDLGEFPPPEKNLVYRAAEMFLKTTGIDKGLSIDLLKSIPMESGLGGGSSNAAGILLTLDALFQTNLTKAQLTVMAANLGSDVPFFLFGGTSICRGRGERVLPIPFPHSNHFVLVRPNFGLSTQKIFSQLNLADNPFTFNKDEFLRNAGQYSFNRLQPAANLENPQVNRICNLLRRAGCDQSILTGSGSCCFGFCQSAEEANRIARAVVRQDVGMVLTCKNLGKYSVPLWKKSIG